MKKYVLLLIVLLFSAPVFAAEPEKPTLRTSILSAFAGVEATGSPLRTAILEAFLRGR